MTPKYFVGKSGETSHDDPEEYRVGGWPVFFTYNESNPREKHYNARFCHYEDAIEWVNFMNRKKQ